MIEWREVPWSLWAYGALNIIAALAWLLFASVGNTGLALISVAVIVVWFYFLLRGIRWLWLGTIILSALILVADLASGSGTWYGDLVGLIGIVLLLLPPTRRFFRNDPIVEPS